MELSTFNVIVGVVLTAAFGIIIFWLRVIVDYAKSINQNTTIHKEKLVELDTKVNNHHERIVKIEDKIEFKLGKANGAY